MIESAGLAAPVNATLVRPGLMYKSNGINQQEIGVTLAPRKSTAAPKNGTKFAENHESKSMKATMKTQTLVPGSAKKPSNKWSVERRTSWHLRLFRPGFTNFS